MGLLKAREYLEKKLKREQMESKCEQCENPNLKVIHTCKEHCIKCNGSPLKIPHTCSKMEKEYKLLRKVTTPVDVYLVHLIQTESQWIMDLGETTFEGMINVGTWFEEVKEREVKIKEVSYADDIWTFSINGCDHKEISKLLNNKQKIINCIKEILDEN